MKCSRIFVQVLLFWILSSGKLLFSSQPFELNRHFYYKIEKNNQLIGYAEEYLKPVKELPNLEVEITFKTLIGERFSPPRNILLEKSETYLIDLTYDRILSGEIEYLNQPKKKSFHTSIDFNRYRLAQKSTQQTGSIDTLLLSRNTVPVYHRFLARFIEKRLEEKLRKGETPIIWSDRGEVAFGFWEALDDTTLTVNGVRLLCHHFVLHDENQRLAHEMWTISNSGRLVRSLEVQTGVSYELADVVYKNYFESAFFLAANKPQLTYLSAQIFDKANSTTKSIDSKRLISNLDQIQVPLNESVVDSFAAELEPIQSEAQFDADTLFQIASELMKFNSYLDEVLMSFSRWSNSQYTLNSTLNKKIDVWKNEDYFRFRESLALFSRTCRVRNIPARFVRGIYCLSVVDQICYNWIWIEVCDGKKWHPWHLEMPHPEMHGAEFVRIQPVNWDYVKDFKFTPIEKIRVTQYQLEVPKSLF